MSLIHLAASQGDRSSAEYINCVYQIVQETGMLLKTLCQNDFYCQVIKLRHWQEMLCI